LWFTLFLIRTQSVDTYDQRQTLWLWFVLCIGCIFISLVLLAVVSRSELTHTERALGFVVFLTLVLIVFPVFERQFRFFVDQRFASNGFQEAQMAANAATEKNASFVEVHFQYVEILKRWSAGSSNVFLSEGVLSSGWPASSIPNPLILLVRRRGWTAFEMLEANNQEDGEVHAYLVQNQIGAAVGYVTPSGDMLVSLFKVRDSERPFVPRELREAHELLRQMQIGLSFARMRQTQRGDDRLNFYGRYAPQFAHELRNGLYLQTQLLRAIANGRGDSVLPSDAKAGLEKVEQVDRLCRHFFSAGAVFRQPLREIRIHEVLRSISDRAQALIGSSAEVELRVDAPEGLEVVTNPDMLGIALQNLILNASEALAAVPAPRRIELSASVQFERVRILVRDNGPGMPADRVRDPFSPGRSQKKGGMGLGLSIVRDCIEAMGGTIGLRPPSGTGVCFEITLVCPSRGRIDSLPRRSFLPPGQNSVQAV
jgi:signal transduction histidine kinase